MPLLSCFGHLLVGMICDFWLRTLVGPCLIMAKGLTMMVGLERFVVVNAGVMGNDGVPASHGMGMDGVCTAWYFGIANPEGRGPLTRAMAMPCCTLPCPHVPWLIFLVAWMVIQHATG